MHMLRGRGHNIYTLECRKKALSANDDKRNISPNGINTDSRALYNYLN